MNNYEYIIASLPDISSSFRGELDYQDVLEQIRSQLSKKDIKDFDFLQSAFVPDNLDADLYLQARKSPNAFIRSYLEYDRQVRNCKVKYLNKALGRPEGLDLVILDEEEQEFEDSAKVFEILDTSDILQRERSLDDLMWEQINYICALQVFSLDVILAFCAKLQIVVRWLKLDPQRGAELFIELVNELRNNKKPIE